MAATELTLALVDAQQIAKRRTQYNTALLAHEWAAVRACFMPDYTCLPGSSGKPIDSKALGRVLSQLFDDPTFVTFVRTPERVTVSQSGERAAETGNWVGIWRMIDGEMRRGGVYQAFWAPYHGAWRLQNESFVTLRCWRSVASVDIDDTCE